MSLWKNKSKRAAAAATRSWRGMKKRVKNFPERGNKKALMMRDIFSPIHFEMCSLLIPF